MTLSSHARHYVLNAAIIASLPLACTAQQKLPAYIPAQQVTGTIHIWGSPQIGDLLNLYEQSFAKLQPGVRFDNDLKSTITAVAGVYTGRADIGLLGREIWPTEALAFQSIAGHPPTVVDVATGSYNVPKATFALTVFVHKSNPLTSLSLQQLEQIFAASNKPIRTWADLGIHGALATHPIHLYGFNIDNDKSQIFSQLVFHEGERWSSQLHEFNNKTGANAADAGALILQAVADDPDGIGISNIFYATPAVKALALSTTTHPAPIPASPKTIGNRTYPLTRAVYMVVDTLTDHPANAAVTQFLRYVLSPQAQDDVRKEGNYLPLPDAVALDQLKRLAK